MSSAYGYFCYIDFNGNDPTLCVPMVSLSVSVVVGSALSEETKKEGRKESEEERRKATRKAPRWSLNSSTRSGTGKGIADIAILQLLERCVCSKTCDTTLRVLDIPPVTIVIDGLDTGRTCIRSPTYRTVLTHDSRKKYLRGIH